MAMVLNEEAGMLKDAARGYLKASAPVSQLRKLRDSGSEDGFDRKTWADMAEMGWTGVIIPEAYGGSDFGYLSLGLVLEETGRTLTASPLGATALAATSALLLGGSEAQKEAWLPKIATGETIAALAVDEGPRHDPSKIEAKAEKSGDGWVLSGEKAFVAEGDSAHLFIVAAQTGEGVGLFLVPGDAAGITRKSRNMVDARSHAAVSFDGVTLGGDALIGSADGADLLDQVLDRARAGVAAEMLGMAVQAFEDTLAYLKTREQFGVAIGSYQALQHRMVDTMMAYEQSKSLLFKALCEYKQEPAMAAETVHALKVLIDRNGKHVFGEAIQMHGGMGMTDELDIGHFAKRLMMINTTFGDATYHRNRYIETAYAA